MRRWWVLAAGALVVLLVAAAVAAFLLDEPLRGYLERQANANLDGYTVAIGALDFHPLGFSIDFEDLVVSQDAHPDPPVVRIPRLTASVQWRELLRARLVADFALERPAVHVDLVHLRQEAKDEVPVKDRGWQAALQALYPLRINRLTVRDGRLAYVDAGQARPLTLSAIEVVAGNIRNIASEERVYPSTLWAEATVFERGRLEVDGTADFLATPHPGVLAKVRIEDVPLDYFRPVAARYNVVLGKGMLSASGDVEYGPAIKALHVEDAVLREPAIEYVHAPRQAPRATEQVAEAAKTTARKAGETADDPGVQLRVGRLQVTGGTFGFVNRAAQPDYRVFLTGTRVDLRNLSNHFVDGPASIRLTGRFMGSGETTATGAFRSDVNGPDFDLNVRIVDTDLRAMNDLLRAHGKFDVVGGLFSLYSELTVEDRAVQGYVKPLFRNLDVYDERQDREKGLFRKLYERVVGGLSALLENEPREEVATRAEVKGRLENPRASTWEVVVRLVQNAFFRAILPGFEEEVRRVDRS